MGKKDEMHKGECMMTPCMMEKKISDELALTPEQKVKVDAIFDAKRAEKEAHKKEMMAKMEKTHNDIKAILTPEQITKFDAIITEMCPTQMGGMKEGKPCCKKQTEGCQKMKE